MLLHKSMPRTVAKKAVTKTEFSYANDIAIWTMIGAYLVGMFVAMELSQIALVDTTSVAVTDVRQTTTVAY